jgi:phosphatidylinositol alpha-1,6-mannosyltransferase
LKSSLFFGATTLRPGNGGIGRVARMSATALSEDGYSLEINTLLDKDPQMFAGRHVATANNSKLIFAARCGLATMSHSRFFYDSAGISRAHLKVLGMRRPKAVWIHGREVWGIPALRQDYAAAVRSADLVLVNSHYTLARAQRTLGPLPQAKVCWLATELDEESSILSPADGPPTVLILGRIDEREGYKGHRELIEAWHRVANAVPGARLLIAGVGIGLQDVRDQVAASKVASQIEILGFVPESEIEALWKRTHIMAMPSRGEGFGLVYVEAMRHGIPIITSLHDAGQEVNLEGKTGFNVSLDDNDQLTERLIILLTDSALRNKMGEAGRRRWRQHFTFSAFKSRFLAIMEPFLSI